MGFKIFFFFRALYSQLLLLLSSSFITMTTFQQRNYVDPWDLDLREVSWRHSSDTTDCSADQVVSLSSAAGPESTRSDFVYVPGPPEGKSARSRARSVPRYECCQCSPKSSLAILPPDQSKRRLFYFFFLGEEVKESYCKTTIITWWALENYYLFFDFTNEVK